MHFLGLVLLAIAKVLRMIINLYTIIVALAAIISWVRPDPYNPIVHFLTQATEPAFRLARRMIPRSFYRTGFDLSPLLVFVLLVLIDTIVIGLLFEWAHSLMSQ